jgi:hypothetical protein
VKFRDSVLQSRTLHRTVPDSNSLPEPEQQEASGSEASDVFHETEEGLEGIQSLSGLIIVDPPITLIFKIDEPTLPSDPYTAQSMSHSSNRQGGRFYLLLSAMIASGPYERAANPMDGKSGVTLLR